MTPFVITLVASISFLTSMGMLLLGIRLLKCSRNSRNPGCSTAGVLPVIALNLLLALYFWGMTLDARSGEQEMLEGYIHYIWAAPAAMATLTVMLLAFLFLRSLVRGSR